jgi:hypothetical protein
MRFNTFVAGLFLITLAAGLVIPVNIFSSRDLESKEDNDNVRKPSFTVKKVYKVSTDDKKKPFS